MTAFICVGDKNKTTNKQTNKTFRRIVVLTHSARECTECMCKSSKILCETKVKVPKKCDYIKSFLAFDGQK